MSVSSLGSATNDPLQNQTDPTNAGSSADAAAQLAAFQTQLQQSQLQQTSGSSAGAQPGQSGHHHGGHHHHAPAATAASGTSSKSSANSPPSVLSMLDAIPDDRSAVLGTQS